LTGPDLPDGEPERQSGWFLVLFALAAAGGAVAYVPLLTVLLPQRIAAPPAGVDRGAPCRFEFLVAPDRQCPFGVRDRALGYAVAARAQPDAGPADGLDGRLFSRQ
jgi:hypothetical protein